MFVLLSAPAPVGEPLETRVNDSIRRFIRAYRENAVMLAQMEQVGTYSPDMRELKIATREAFVHRTRRGLHHAIAENIADPNLDVEYVSEVLGSMLEYTCYMWITVGMDFDEQRVIDALALVWTNATAPRPATIVQGAVSLDAPRKSSSIDSQSVS
jgi:hypothetical protein